MSLYTTTPPAKREPSSGSHGTGLFATQQIRQGTLILEEEPLAELQIPGDRDRLSRDEALEYSRRLKNRDAEELHDIALRVTDTYSYMSANGFRRLIKDPNSESVMTLLNAVLERAYPHGSKRQDGWVFLCETVLKINHSCRPNAEAVWDEAKQRLSVRATKIIEREEEITISYIDQNCARQERWNKLGFDCKCEECSLMGEDHARSELDREALKSFYYRALIVRKRHGLGRLDVFSMAETDAYAIIKDQDATDLIAMMRFFMQDSSDYSLSLALAMDTIAIIFTAWTYDKNEDEPGFLFEMALKHMKDELRVLKVCLGTDHECTKTVSKQVEALRKRAQSIEQI